MKRKIRTDGDSAIITIPKAWLELLDLSIGDIVELEMKNKTIKVKKDKL